MLAFVNTPSAQLPIELREVAHPQPAADEALVAPRGTIVMFGNSSRQETPFNLANLT